LRAVLRYKGVSLLKATAEKMVKARARALDGSFFLEDALLEVVERGYNELRWNPLLGCWVIVSSSRSARPWRRVERCPFCPGSEEAGFGWDVLVLDNRYPALRPDAVVSRAGSGSTALRGPTATRRWWWRHQATRAT